jgi:O-antigen/teichoic acid export membrane protein
MNVLRQWPLYLIGRIVPALIAFAAIAIYTRLLDPASFGMAILLTSTSVLTGTFLYSWLRVATLRMMASVNAIDEPDYVATIVISFLLASVAVVAVIPKLSFSLFAWTAAGTVVGNWFELNVTLVQARTKLVAFGILQGSKAVATMAATLTLISMGFSVDALLAGIALGNCVAFAFVGMWFPMRTGRFDIMVVKRFLLFGWSASLNSLSAVAITLQRSMLSIVDGSASLGICTAAMGISDKTIGLLVGTATLAGQPLAFRAHDTGASEQLKSQMRDNFRLIFSVGIGSAACIVALSEPITHIFLGEKFRLNAQPIINLAAIGMFVSCTRMYYFEQIFEIALTMRPVAILTVVRTVLLIGLSAVLIPRFGGIGLVSANLAVETFSCIATALWSLRLTSISLPVRSFIVPLVASGTMATAIHLVSRRDTIFGFTISLVVAAIAFGSVYMVVYGRQLRSLIRLPKRILSPESGS